MRIASAITDRTTALKGRKGVNLGFINEKAEKYDPELLFISSLLHEGTYNYGDYGVTDSVFESQSRLHGFCKRYALQNEKKSPPVDLVQSKFDLNVFEWCDPRFAAQELIESYNNKQMRRAIQRQTKALQTEGVESALSEARTIGTDLIASRTGSVGLGDDLTTFETVEYAIPTPGHTREKVPAIRAGELCYIGARPGSGKSWRLIEYGVTAVKEGYDVLFFSLEMTASDVVKRARRLLNGDPDSPYQHRNGDGDFKVVDTSHLKSMLTPDKVEMHVRSLDTPTLVIIDYVGLMGLGHGRPAIEKWNNMAMISNALKLIANQNKVPIVAAAQFNRAAEANQQDMTVAALAQSDALGQDADVVIGLVSHHEHKYTTNYLLKYRHGVSNHVWFTDFDPANRRMGEITAQEAEMRVSMSTANDSVVASSSTKVRSNDK